MGAEVRLNAHGAVAGGGGTGGRAARGAAAAVSPGKGAASRNPAWTPMLLFAACVWAAAACTVRASQALSAPQCAAAAAGAAGAAMACGCLLLRKALHGGGAHAGCGKMRRARPVRASGVLLPVAALGCAVGCLLAASAAAGMHSAFGAIDDGSSRAVAFVALEDSREGDFGPTCTARATLEDGSVAKVRVNLPEGAEVRCWQAAEVSCPVKAPSSTAAAYYWGKGCVGSISPRRVQAIDPHGALGAICALRNRGIAACDAACVAAVREGVLGAAWDAGTARQAFSLLKAVLFGYRADLFSSSFYDDVKTAGLAHIVAVSGAHLVIVTGFFSALLKAARVPKRACVPLQLGFVFAYAAFAGMPVSALRAASMTCCALSAFYAGRRSSSVTALSACIVVMLCLDPFLSASVSLALSSCASLGIVLLARYLAEWFDALFGGRMRAVSQSLGATFAANALTLPVSCAVFGQLPLIGPVSNLVATPLFTATVCTGISATAICCLFPGHDAFLFAVPALLARLTVEAVRGIADVPYACVTADVDLVFGLAASAGAVALLLRFRPAPTRPRAFCAASAGACCVVLALFALPNVHGTEVVMLDVGQGDAVVYRTGAHAVLVDTGTDDAAVLAGLARHDVRRLDAVVVTHADDDHCGSLQAVLDTVPVGRVCVAEGTFECESENCAKLLETARQCDVAGLRTGDELSFGNFRMLVLSPDGFHDEGGNADSIVLSVSADCDRDGTADWTAFASGDAEADALAPLVEKGAIGRADILKVPHHGSKDGLDERLLQALSPEVALVSVGEGNRYGHPAEQTLELLQGCGARVYRTDVAGDVVCSLTASSLKVSAER